MSEKRHASAHTIASYRDTWRLLLAFAHSRTGIPPSQLDLADVDAELVAAFLDHLETARGNNTRTRNVRLAAIHSLFRYAALAHPEHANTIARVLAIPVKRTDRALVTFLNEPEVEALLAAPDQETRTGRREHALLLVSIQCGLRISELIALSRGDVHLGTGAHVTCTGKGRKQRTTPLATNTVLTLRNWLNQRPGQPTDPVFPSRDGQRLSRDAIEHRLAQYIEVAGATCMTLHSKRVTTHSLRHTACRHAGDRNCCPLRSG
jgi:integrase/recombinase XerD